jgi:heptosyltransferase II
MRSPPEKILIVGPSWVGDMVLAQSLFKQLKIDRPDATLDVIAPSWTLALLKRMPEVHHAIELPFKHGDFKLIDRIKMGIQLQRHQYTQAILLTNSLKSALIPFFAKIPQRTSFLGEFRYGLINDIRPLNKEVLKKTVDRFVYLGHPNSKEISQPPAIPAPQFGSDISNAKAILKQKGIPLPNKKILGLCPGAEYGEAKRWPIDYFAQTALDAIRQGWDVWIFGSEKDVQVTAEINKKTQYLCQDWGGKTTLDEAIDLMGLTHTVVSNDSGLMHIAAALGKNVVALYGSSDPNHTPPMSPTAKILYKNLPCSPCFKRICPLKTPESQMQCLKQISPQEVLKSL